MNKCERCIHKPICEWVASNFEAFKFPIEKDVTCILFHEEAEKTVCDCKEANCTDFDHTIDMMRSPDYKERFKAEYHQTKIRYEKLKAFNNKIEAFDLTRYAGALSVEEPKHDCPAHLLVEQQHMMGQYLHILEVRAVIEGIEL